MARKPQNFQWHGFNDEQIRLLNSTDTMGNNNWARNSYTEEMMTKHLSRCADAGLSIGQIIEAMRSIGYEENALHSLARWESKRTTGRFGK